MIDKEKVKKSFSKAASGYDTASALQKEVVKELAIYLRNALGERACVGAFGAVRQTAYAAIVPEGQRVLDIGAGTGALALALKAMLNKAEVVSSDISYDMLKKAKNKAGLRLFATADFEALPFAENSFDVVASSLAYQWAFKRALAFREAFRVLSPGGTFVFSTFGKGTLAELKESCVLACEARLKAKRVGFVGFADFAEIKSCLIAEGFEAITIDMKVKLKNYESLRSLLSSLKAVGANIPACYEAPGLSGAVMLKDASRIYEEKFPSGDSGISATYAVMYIAARKPVNG
ncbi:methyltransferase domain-containing protein [bacterium]|nr:MAG: methyltransferase domain-containing protein [bacterium]